MTTTEIGRATTTPPNLLVLVAELRDMAASPACPTCRADAASCASGDKKCCRRCSHDTMSARDVLTLAAAIQRATAEVFP